MNPEDIKKSIKELWERTFHDNNEIVSLIFETYYDEKYLAYSLQDSKVVSALLGIPYSFGYGDTILKGLYLFGMATEEKFRNKGFMTSLIDEINTRVSNDFDFTFLVPISDLNADYYRRRGYFNSFFRIEERFTSIHDFKNDFEYSLINSDERVAALKIKLFDKFEIIDLFTSEKELRKPLIDFIKKQENKPSSSANLRHSDTDLEAIIEYYRIRGSYIFLSIDEERKITGVVFAVKDEMKRLKIPAFYVEDKSTFYALLNNLKKSFSDFSISVFITSEKDSSHNSLIEEVYGAENPEGRDLETLFGLLETQFNLTKLMEPFGMVKLLRFDNILSYISQIRKDSDFKLNIKNKDEEDNGEQKILYSVKNGKLKIEGYEQLPKEKNILTLSRKEVSELLLRKPDTSSFIMEAFGIPRLILEMKLILPS